MKRKEPTSELPMCLNCDYIKLKYDYDRPYFCAECEFKYCWRKMIDEVGLFRAIERGLIWVLDGLTWLIEKLNSKGD